MTNEQILSRTNSIRNLNSPKAVSWLLNLARSQPSDRFVCEVGTYFGYVSAALALLGKRVITIDHMLCGFCDIAPNEKCLYLDVINNLVSCGAWSNIVPFPIKSEAALDILEFINPSIGLLYLDGDHSAPTVLMELQRFEKFIPIGGAVCGDDCTMASNTKVNTGKITFNSCWSAGLEDEFTYANVNYGPGVTPAVWEFFRNNPKYEVMNDLPYNQFGFTKIA